MKAIILTYAPITDFERNILKKTDIFKLALNQHAEELEPDMRIITDYVLPKILSKFSQKVVSLREKLRYYSERVEYFDAEFKGTTISAAIEYLMYKNFDEILIVGDNNVHSDEFKNLVNQSIESISNKPKIYQYSKGNFNLPILKISDFCAK